MGRHTKSYNLVFFVILLEIGHTFFGYDGVGACRRVKDQIVDELRKEGTTWGELVQRAVESLSLVDAPKTTAATDGASDSALSILIKEAHDIERQLEDLALRLESNHA